MAINLKQKTVNEVLYTAQQFSFIENLELFRKKFHSLLKNILDFEKCNFFTRGICNNEKIPPHLYNVTSYGISDRNLKLYRQYYHQLDPFARIIKMNRPPSVVTFEQIIPLKKLIRTELYIDFLKPQSIHDGMSLFLTSGNRLLGVIAIFRSSNSPGFSEIDRAKAEMIAPFITAALDRVIGKQENHVLEQTVTSLLTSLPCQGVIVLDRSLSPVYSSESTVNLVSILNPKINPHRPLVSNLPKELLAACADLFGAPSGSKEKPCKTLSVELSTDKMRRQMTVQVKKIHQHNSEPFILLFINPNNQNMVSENLNRRFGISTREMDIVDLLSKGKKNSEIGKELFISEYTVENHLRSIYRKMQVKNRTALVLKIIKDSAVN